MVDVVKWPPVSLTAFEITTVAPIAVSNSLINAKPYVSTLGRSRREATNIVSGFGLDAAGAGYIEMFKEYLDGGTNLIRLDVTSGIWHFARAGNNSLLQNDQLVWLAGTDDLDWTAGGDDLLWYLKDLSSTAVTDDGGFPALRVTGLPPSQIVIRPHEVISLWVGGVKEQRRAVRVTRSDADGVAIIRVKTAFTGDGQCSLGDTESIVFRVKGQLPRAVQPQQGEWTYDWSLVEAFSDEYDSFVEVDPWG